MTEDEARAWLIAKLNVSRGTLDKLAAYAALVRAGQATQNLVSASTLPTFWSRHIVDSAQLVLLAPPGRWLDVGSGAGVPGMVTAILTGQPTMLVEPRARRAAFLEETAEALDLGHVHVVLSTMQKLVADPADIITARAVAPMPTLLQMALPFAHDGTIWLFPKGKSAQTELASLNGAWQGQWSRVPSVTDLQSDILVGRNVRMKSRK